VQQSFVREPGAADSVQQRLLGGLLQYAMEAVRVF
jgi:hypothetical protein